MSVYYEIKEHLNMHRRDGAYDSKAALEAHHLMHSQLALLGAQMLQDMAEDVRLRLCADGEQLTFAGEFPNEDFRAILQKLKDAEEIDLVAEYCFCYVGGNGISEAAGPFAMMGLLDSAAEDELEGIFYSAWNNADCADGEGILCAYGRKNGRMYQGEVEFEACAEFPAGDWYALDGICVDEQGLSAADAKAAAAICEELAVFSLDTQSRPEFDEHGVTCFLNNVRLRTGEDYARFIGLFARLDSICAEAGLFGKFRDDSGDDVRLLNMDFADGAAVLRIAQV